MTHTLTVTLSEPVYAALKRAADAAAKEPAVLLADTAAASFPPLDAFPPPGGGDIRRFFGTIRGSSPPGLDNEQIDAVLAAEYGSTHETP